MPVSSIGIVDSDYDYNNLKELHMYKHTSIMVLALVLVSSFTLAAQPIEEVQTTTPVAVQALTEEPGSTAEGLLYMREEEKLARDVYIALYEKWGLRTFLNIAESEQQHMDAVRALLAARNIEDPVAGSDFGEFKNTDLAALYSSLVSQGMQSASEAYRVGAIIEDLDIYDLKEYLTKTTDEAEIWVYTNLLKGSENHLRTFTKQLERYGVTYTARYISDAELQAILSGR